MKDMKYNGMLETETVIHDNRTYYKLHEKVNDNFIEEPEKRIPVAYEVDATVVGGGVSGLFAAIQAGRSGLLTLLIERTGCLGGNIGPGMVIAGSTLMGCLPETKEVIRGGAAGIPEEFAKRFTELKKQPGIDYAEESAIASYLGIKMCEEAGVKILFSCVAADPIMENSIVKGLYVEGKSGRVAVLSRIVIDATGDAALAKRAGAPMIEHVPPRDEDALLISKTRRLKDFPWWNETALPYLVGGVESDSGTKGLFYDKLGFKGQFDSNSMIQMSFVEQYLRTEVFETIVKMRSDKRGFENAYLLATASYVGARGGACIQGEHVLTIKEAWEGALFDDVIFRIVFRRDLPDYIKPGFNKEGFDVPYSIMLPKKIDGMLVIGRGASYIRRGHDGTGNRVRLAMMTLGQVAGIAAGVAVKDCVLPKEIDIKKVQMQMIKEGYDLGDEKRLRKLGVLTDN